MREFFEDVFEYHHHFNQLLLNQLREIEKKLPERTIPLFFHCINAHQIWNARISATVALPIDQLHTFDACRLVDMDNYQNTLKILVEEQLERRISYENSKGNKYSNTLQQILFHIANHFSHHKGQVISDIRQSGVSPIVTDYISYKR